MKKETKILWTVDAFTEDRELYKKYVKIITQWVKGSRTAVEPVYVMSPDQIKVPEEVFANIRGNVEQSAQNKLGKLLKNCKIPGLLKPVYLASFNYSLHKAIETLLDYAKTSGATLIAVSTQARKGATRFLFGSFAEKLILHSHLPVLMVNPRSDTPRSFKRVLFATDLSEKANETFDQVLELTKQHKMKLILFNKVDYFTEFTAKTIVSSSMYTDYLSEDIERRKKALEAMADIAKSQGLLVATVLDEDPKVFSVTDALLKAAQKNKADLIAMSSHTGPVETAILGSVTRQVVRQSTLPIWILHPRPRTQTQGDIVPLSTGKRGVVNA